MELLAPAGYFKCVPAAIAAGADAIYLGAQIIPHMRSQGQAFNLTREELHNASELCRREGKKLYFTLNAPYTSRQLDGIKEHLSFLANLSLDGLIVADLGVIQLLRNELPEIKLIASAQMGISNIDSARFVESIGVNRIILDRYVTIDDAIKIKEATHMEVELFAFGMQCFSYDAFCFMGQYFTGAACENTCMSTWKYASRECRLMYLKFYNILRNIPRLIDAGIEGLKIEGRNRSANYVGKTTRIFREAIDLCKDEKLEKWEQALSACALYEEVTDGALVTGFPLRKHVTKSFKMRSRLAYLNELLRILFDTRSFSTIRHEIRSAIRLDIGGIQ